MVSLKGFVFLAWISFGSVALPYAVLATEYCRMLEFNAPIPDKALSGHMIRTEEVADEESCRIKCYLEPNCVSINVGPADEGKHTCELNNGTDESKSQSSMKERKHYSHHAAENFCRGDPCPGNITLCQVGFTKKGYRCACGEGYANTGLDHAQCEDIDECTTASHDCSPFAVCNNVPGSYGCTCKPGFSGNGNKCTDVDECNIPGPVTCSANADCVNKLGSFECKCRPGYAGNGTDCEDIDECTLESHDCSPFADCNNAPGAYRCVCKSGFTGNGKTCSAFVCEKEYLKIRCDDDGIIDIISANFGRLDDHTCPHKFMATNCRANKSLSKVQETCQNQTSCTIPAKSHFFGGDPCGGTFKYLLVEYKCNN